MTPHAPTFSAEEARKIARELYGIDASVGGLPSYYDQNFHIEQTSGRRFVLKIAHASERRDVLDLQNCALRHVGEAAGALRVPRVCSTISGERIAAVCDRAGVRHFARLLTYVEGTPWAAAPSYTPARLQRLGRLVGALDRALAGFSHSAMHRFLDWDLKHLLGLQEHLGGIARPERREMIERILRRFESFVAPRLVGLRQSVIHSDVNNDNVLLDDDGEVVGVIDFGDVVHTVTVCEVAIAMAYAMLDHMDPLAAGAYLLRGYHEVHPLEAAELDVLLDLVCGRLAMSVTFAAHFKRRDPHNVYVTANEASAWRLLEQLIDCESERVRRKFAEQTLGVKPRAN